MTYIQRSIFNYGAMKALRLKLMESKQAHPVETGVIGIRLYRRLLALPTHVKFFFLYESSPR